MGTKIYICVAVDHSASLVRIAYQLGDSPFGVVHHHLAASSSIVMLWVIGRHGTAAWNCSAMRRLLIFTADLFLFFMAQYAGIKDENICVAANHSASLVGIADSPFGVVHRRLALAYNIVLLWVIGRQGTTSRNCSEMRRLLLFTIDLLVSFRAPHTRAKGENVIYWRLAEWIWRLADLPFFILL
ncbi:hypothetical protein MTR67_023645, partial [Solanum verrucosum]